MQVCDCEIASDLCCLLPRYASNSNLVCYAGNSEWTEQLASPASQAAQKRKDGRGGKQTKQAKRLPCATGLVVESSLVNHARSPTRSSSSGEVWAGSRWSVVETDKEEDDGGAGARGAGRQRAGCGRGRGLGWGGRWFIHEGMYSCCCCCPATIITHAGPLLVIVVVIGS